MPKIIVVGIGGIGCKIVREIKDTGVTTIAIDTDKQNLLETGADKKVLVGVALDRDKDFEAKKFEVLEDLLDAEIVFVCLGPSRLDRLAPAVVEIAKKRGATVVVIVLCVSEISERIKKLADMVITLKCDRSSENFSSLPH